MKCLNILKFLFTDLNSGLQSRKTEYRLEPKDGGDNFSWMIQNVFVAPSSHFGGLLKHSFSQETTKTADFFLL
jgi:hypothetical protein